MSCTEARKLCLKIPIKGLKTVEFCQEYIDREGKKSIYTPANALHELLNYDTINVVELKDNDENCYSFDTALIVVIRDIQRKLDNFSNIDFLQAFNDKIIQDTFNKDMENNPNKPLDIANLFLKIVALGEERWKLPKNCENDEKCKLAKNLLVAMEIFVNTTSFSRTLTDIQTNPEQILAQEGEGEQEQEAEQEAEQEGEQEGEGEQEQKRYIELLKSLFESTILFIAPLSDLSKEKVEKIIKDIDELTRLFKESNVGGGFKRLLKRVAAPLGLIILNAGIICGGGIYRFTEELILGDRKYSVEGVYDEQMAFYKDVNSRMANYIWRSKKSYKKYADEKDKEYKLRMLNINEKEKAKKEQKILNNVMNLTYDEINELLTTNISNELATLLRHILSNRKMKGGRRKRRKFGSSTRNKKKTTRNKKKTRRNKKHHV